MLLPGDGVYGNGCWWSNSGRRGLHALAARSYDTTIHPPSLSISAPQLQLRAPLAVVLFVAAPVHLLGLFLGRLMSHQSCSYRCCHQTTATVCRITVCSCRLFAFFGLHSWRYLTTDPAEIQLRTQTNNSVAFRLRVIERNRDTPDCNGILPMPIMSILFRSAES